MKKGKICHVGSSFSYCKYIFLLVFLSLFQFGRVNYGIVSFTLTMIYPLFFCKKGNNFHVYLFFLMHIVAQIIGLHQCQSTIQDQVAGPDTVKL